MLKISEEQDKTWYKMVKISKIVNNNPKLRLQV